MKEDTQSKDLKIRAQHYDLGFEEQSEHSKIEEIMYIKLQKYEVFHTLC